MNIGIYTFEKYHNRPYNSVGSSRIRGRWLMNNWQEADEFELGHHYDAVIFQKVYWRDYLSSYDGIKILDICDKDWPDQPVVQSLNMADACVVPTKGLQKSIKRFVPSDYPVVIIPDRVDLDRVPRTKKDYGYGDIKTAVWYGYSMNLDVLKPAFIDLARMNISLTIISDKSDVRISGYGFDSQSKKYDQKTIYNDLAAHDVVLNPRQEKGKYDYKSNNKTIIAWAAGCPVAHTLGELKELNTPEARKEHVDEKIKLVERKYDIKQSVKKYKSLLGELV